MKKVLFVLVLMMAVLAVSAQSDKTDFTGKWNLNTEKSIQSQSDQGTGGIRVGGGNFVATQDSDLLTIERTRTDQDGKSTTITMKYTLDGKESINTSPLGDSKSIANWSADGKALNIETTRTMDINGESMTMNSTEGWNLNADNTLTVVYTRQSPDGDVKATMVYDKK
jgi:hypothetical protein